MTIINNNDKKKAIRTICKRVTETPYKNKSPYITLVGLSSSTSSRNLMYCHEIPIAILSFSCVLSNLPLSDALMNNHTIE